MSYYYNSFTYKNINSLKDKGLIIVAFEPDNGFVDSFLSMDSIQEDTFDNTSKYKIISLIYQNISKILLYNISKLARNFHINF